MPWEIEKMSTLVVRRYLKNDSEIYMSAGLVASSTAIFWTKKVHRVTCLLSRGGSRGGPGGPQNFIKRKKNAARMHADAHVLVVNSYPDPPLSETLYPPLTIYVLGWGSIDLQGHWQMYVSKGDFDLAVAQYLTCNPTDPNLAVSSHAVFPHLAVAAWEMADFLLHIFPYFPKRTHRNYC